MKIEFFWHHAVIEGIHWQAQMDGKKAFSSWAGVNAEEHAGKFVVGFSA
jgi:hypothetical protein